MQNLQKQEEISRIVMTAAAADPSSKSSSKSSSTSASSGPSQTRQRMTNQVQTSHAPDASSASRSSSSLAVPNIGSPAPPSLRLNTQIPIMPMLFTPTSAIMFHNPSAMMYQEGAAPFHHLQLTDPSLQHVPVLNSNRASMAFQESSLKQHHPTMLPFSLQQGFDASVDPLQRAHDITSSIGHFLPTSSFLHDAPALERKKELDLADLEKKCYSRIIEAGISSSKKKSPKKQETSPSTNFTKKKEKDELDVLRPLSAYNFFFCDERDRLLKGKDSTSAVESCDMRKERLLSQHVAKDRSKRRPHRKTHGKITFTTLSKLIGQRWRHLPEVEKNFFKDVAKADLMRYQDEMATIQKKQDVLMAPIALCYAGQPR